MYREIWKTVEPILFFGIEPNQRIHYLGPRIHSRHTPGCRQRRPRASAEQTRPTPPVTPTSTQFSRTRQLFLKPCVNDGSRKGMDAFLDRFFNSAARDSTWLILIVCIHGSACTDDMIPATEYHMQLDLTQPAAAGQHGDGDEMRHNRRRLMMTAMESRRRRGHRRLGNGKTRPRWLDDVGDKDETRPAASRRRWQCSQDTATGGSTMTTDGILTQRIADGALTQHTGGGWSTMHRRWRRRRRHSR